MTTIRKIVPSIFTSINIALGMIAILCDDQKLGALLIIAAIFFDAFDGMAARLLNAQSEIGKQLDSLADIVSFGVAPAFLYFIIGKDFGWMAYGAAAFILIASSLRLAIFNTLPSSKDFVGMATPTLAFMISGIALAHHQQIDFFTELFGAKYFYIFFAVLFSLLLHSPLTMFSLKGMKGNIERLTMAGICLFSFLGLLVFFPYWAVPSSVVIYFIVSIYYHFKIKGTISVD